MTEFAATTASARPGGKFSRTRARTLAVESCRARASEDGNVEGMSPDAGPGKVPCFGIIKPWTKGRTAFCLRCWPGDGVRRRSISRRRLARPRSSSCWRQLDGRRRPELAIMGICRRPPWRTGARPPGTAPFENAVTWEPTVDLLVGNLSHRFVADTDWDYLEIFA